MEREQFEHEQAMAAYAIREAFPKARMEWINYWLSRWWLRKKPLIEMMGGIRLEGDIIDTDEDEEGERDSDRGEKANLIQEFDEEWSMLLIPQHVFIKKNNSVLIENIDRALKRVGDDDYIKQVTNGMQVNIADNTAHSLSVLNTNGLRAYGLIDHDTYLKIRQDQGAHPPQFVQAINVRSIIRQLINITPLEMIQKGRLSTGMKIGKFLKAMIPEDMFLFRSPYKATMDGEEVNVRDILPIELERLGSLSMEEYQEQQGYSIKYRSVWDEVDIILGRIVQRHMSTGKIIISAAPIDYIMMSVTNSWSSCHYLKNSMYAAGGPAYAIDPSTLIAYKPTSTRCDAFGVTFDNKDWRQVVHVDLENRSAVFGRHYPNDNKSYATTTRSILNHAMADHFGIKANWIKRNGYGRLRSYASYVYCESHGPMTVLKDGGSDPDTYYGVRSLRCFGCGERLRVHNTVICDDCYSHCVKTDRGLPLYTETDEGRRYYFSGDKQLQINSNTYTYTYTRTAEEMEDEELDNTPVDYAQCIQCGEEYPEDEMRYIEDTGEHVCNDCFDENYGTCEHCGDVFHNDYLFYVDGTGYVCEDCLNENFTRCSHCGEIVPNDEAVFMADAAQHWCLPCAELDGFQCSRCSEWHTLENGTYLEYADEMLCSYCFTEHAEFCSACGEAFYKDDMVHTEDETSYCSDCAPDNTIICEGCERVFDNNDTSFEEVYSIGLDRTLSVCDYCYEKFSESNERRRKVI